MERVLTSIIAFFQLGLMVYFCLRFYMNVKKYMKEQMGTRVLQVTCQKCGHTFKGTQDSLKMGIMHKEVSTTKTEIKGGAIVNAPKYSSYARKVYCPYCQKMEWADIADVNEIAEENRKAVMPSVIRLAITLIVLAFVAQILTKIVTAIF